MLVAAHKDLTQEWVNFAYGNMQRVAVVYHQRM